MKDKQTAETVQASTDTVDASLDQGREMPLNKTKSPKKDSKKTKRSKNNGKIDFNPVI